MAIISLIKNTEYHIFSLSPLRIIDRPFVLLLCEFGILGQWSTFRILYSMA